MLGKRWRAPSGGVGGGSVEARPRLSNSRAKSRLVSLTTELKSAHLLLVVGFCVSTMESSGTWGQERQSFLIRSVSHFWRCAKPFVLTIFKPFPGGPGTSVI